jgi:hypothetical protein
MGIVWFNEKPKIGVATLSENNITLNKAATTYFENAYSVMLRHWFSRSKDCHKTSWQRGCPQT